MSRGAQIMINISGQSERNENSAKPPRTPQTQDVKGDEDTKKPASATTLQQPNDGTMVKSATEMAAAKAEASWIEPVGKPVRAGKTSSLSHNHTPDIEALWQSLGMRKTHLAQTYRPLPHPNGQTSPAYGLYSWRIELCGLPGGSTPLGFDILDDTVIGRGSGADIDLGAYDATVLGVSRRHALLRPRAMHLYLLDLGSTNGTYYNTVRLGHAAAHYVAHDDVFTLGALSFAIKIIESPFEMAKRMGDRLLAAQRV